MKKEYKKRRNIERATSFKVQYVSYLNDANEVLYREFSNIKSLSQWVARNDNDNTFGIFIINTLALIDDIWEPFTTIGKIIITLSDLETIVRDLRDDGFKSSTENN